MKKFGIILAIVAVASLAVWFWAGRNNHNPGDTPPEIAPIAEIAPVENVAPAPGAVPPLSSFLPPLDRPKERVTKKPFGIFITPQVSPVRPERFRGYHAGTDFEVFPEEQDADVPVKAVCDGKLELKRRSTGYGGIAAESCELDGNPITVIYGHLELASIRYSVGDRIKAGDVLGILGGGYGPETDGERKHLHLGLHKGPEINILGYVQSQQQLVDWIDPCLYVCQ